MQRLAKAALAGALLAAATSSASALEVWQGHLFITAANNACNAANFGVNGFFSAVLRPNGIDGNGSNTLLALFRGDRYAARYAFTGALAGNGTYGAQHITSTAGMVMGGFGGNYSRGRVRPVPAVGKPTLTVRVRFSDFANIAGCTLQLEGSLGLRPNL